MPQPPIHTSIKSKKDRTTQSSPSPSVPHPPFLSLSGHFTSLVVSKISVRAPLHGLSGHFASLVVPNKKCFATSLRGLSGNFASLVVSAPSMLIGALRYARDFNQKVICNVSSHLIGALRFAGGFIKSACSLSAKSENLLGSFGRSVGTLAHALQHTPAYLFFQKKCLLLMEILIFFSFKKVPATYEVFDFFFQNTPDFRN